MNPADQALTEAAARRAHLEEQWNKATVQTKKKRDEFLASVNQLVDLTENLTEAIADHEAALAAARI